MTINKTTQDLSTLKINRLTQEMYDDALENDQINATELYLTDYDGVDSTELPTSDKIAEFDASAKMNSTDMTSEEVTTLVNGLSFRNDIDMTQEELQTFLSNLNLYGINAVDYIVEQGTDGIWAYRKWNSGIAECWGRAINCSIPANWSTTGVNIALPFIFKTVTNWQVQHQNYQVTNCYGYPNTVTNTYDNINIQTNASAALSTAAFMILCQGTWK